MGNNKIVILLFLVLLACKKPSSYEPSEPVKYEPLPYFPIYPGSYWEYIDSAMITKRVLTKPQYERLKINYTDSIVLDPILLPSYGGSYYLGYNILTFSNNFGVSKHTFETIFSDELNKQFSSRESGSYQKYPYSIVKTYKVVAVNKSINQPYIGYTDSIVTIDQKTSYNYYNYHYYEHQINYFAKNIGIIRVCNVNDTTNDTTITSELKSYFINH